MYSPIVVFTYNRLKELKGLINSLRNCTNVERHDCFFFSDAPSWKKKNDRDSVKRVRDYLHSKEINSIFKSVSVVEADKHKGLRNSVIDGVTKVITKYGRIIDLEDDLVVSEDFLDYMDEGLDYFENNSKIWSVTGFAPPLRTLENYEGSTFLSLRGESLGFGTWADRWNTVDWDGKDSDILKSDYAMQDKLSEVGYDLPGQVLYQMEGYLDSWAVIWAYECSRNDALIVCPKISKVFHRGVDGTHFNGNNTIQQEETMDKTAWEFSDASNIVPNIVSEFRSLYGKAEKYRKRDYLIIYDKFFRQYKLLHKWMQLREDGLSIYDWFCSNDISRIAIYGGGELASHLLFEIMNKDIEVVCIIDRNTKKTFENIKVVSLDMFSDKVDAIIITPITEFQEIRESIWEHGITAKIFSLESIILY